jgi:threonylcarbamoyladenosine tRNA methylthiotransferase MtaB
LSIPEKRVAFHTLGCKLNFSETATISRDFMRHGFKKVEFRNEADIYVLNTCSVTENADKEARKLIRQAKRRNPNASVVVIGCYAQLKSNEIAEIEGVDLVLGAEAKFKILAHLEKIDVSNETQIIQSNVDTIKDFIPSFSSRERTRSFLKIQDGCDYTCSFCTIPMARGKSRNQSIEETIKIAENLGKTDTNEIVLTGVNIGDFGQDSEESFFELLQTLDQVDGLERFRISSIEPNLLTNEIIEFCAKSNKFMPHFHIPLQSGSDKILASMRRRYKRDLYENRVAKIKSVMPHACIGVDVIVGFPGESDADFMESKNFILEMDVSYLHVFTYSERPNTDAIQMDDAISKETRAERSKSLHILSQKKQDFFYQKYLGQT